jgi:hypothetical protein
MSFEKFLEDEIDKERKKGKKYREKIRKQKEEIIKLTNMPAEHRPEKYECAGGAVTVMSFECDYKYKPEINEEVILDGIKYLIIQIKTGGPLLDLWLANKEQWVRAHSVSPF